MSLPAENEKPFVPEIEKLKQQGDTITRRIASAWNDGDARLKGEYFAIYRQLGNLENEVSAARRELGKATARADTLHDTLKATKDQDATRSADERSRIRSSIYGFGIVLIFLGEFPLNAVAFRLFGEQTGVTWIMTGGLAATLVFCAHGLGVLLRQKMLSARDEVFIWLLIGVPLLTITAIAVIREVYLGRFGDATGGLAQLGPIAGTAIFGFINILIYLGALILSYLHHDPEGEMIERLQKDHRAAERRVRKLRRRVTRGDRYAARLEALLEQWRAARDGALHQARMEACRYKDFFEVLMKVYESANRVALQKLLRRQTKQRLRAQRRATRRGVTYQPGPCRTSSESKAFSKWPEIAAERAFPTKLDWAEDHVLGLARREKDDGTTAKVFEFPSDTIDGPAAADPST